ncbi:MAG: hypothetical protein ABSC95_27300 [Acetobacteraceae bacterium]|jgi:hypothetical protein
MAQCVGDEAGTPQRVDAPAAVQRTDLLADLLIRRDRPTIVREDNTFRFDKDALPRDEGPRCGLFR